MTSIGVEGLSGVFMRAFNRTYQHCGEKHFQRYLDEFTVRYNTRVKLGYSDAERAAIALAGAEGKRLTWRRIGEG